MPFKKTVNVNNSRYDARQTERIISEEAVKYGQLNKDLLKLFEKPIIEITEAAFRKYAKAHNADLATEDLEWKRFERILKSML